MNMDFSTNKTPVGIRKEGAFGGNYFWDIYSDINGKWYKKWWNEINEQKKIDQKSYCSKYYDVSVNNMVLNVEHH